MGFFEDLLGTSSSSRGKGTLKEADIASGNLMDITGAQGAAAAGQAGQALGQQMGEQMGRQAATSGSQAATQAARTAGVNKGQAALLGGQEAGRAYTSSQQAGQLAGQQLGMGAYDTAANRQLAATQLHGNIGATESGQGMQQGQNLMGGLSKVAGGAASLLGDGGIVTAPTSAVVGEKGPEAVIPLDDMDKVKTILKTVYASRKKGKKDAKN